MNVAPSRGEGESRKRANKIKLCQEIQPRKGRMWAAQD